MAIECQASGVGDAAKKRCDPFAGINFVDGDGGLLAACSAEGGVDVSERIDGGARNRVELVCNPDADVASPDAGETFTIVHQQIAVVGSAGNFGDYERLGANDDRGLDVANENFGSGGSNETCTADFELASGDGGAWLNLSDFRLVF